MTDVSWFTQASPGGVATARATVEAAAGESAPTDLLVVTEGRILYRRQRVGTGWVWDRIGVPPGSTGVENLACVVTDLSGAVSAVVIGDADGHAWLGGHDAAEAWLDLGRPPPASWVMAARTTRTAHGMRHLLVLGTEAETPWLRQGVDADGTWFSIATDWLSDITEISLTEASTAPGEVPVPHIFAVSLEEGGAANASLRVAVREHSVWTWIHPGPRPDGADIAGLTTTSFRDESGAVTAAALVGVLPSVSGGAETAWMLTGSGRTWRWEEVGRPPGGAGLQAAVVAAKSDDSVAGEEPVVVARAGHTWWRWSRAGKWVELGTTPGDVTVVDPLACFELDTPSGPKLWAAGVGRDSHLWIADVQDTAVHWEDHGIPSTVTSIVGAYTDPLEPDTIGRMAHQYVIDDLGRLWGSSQGDPFSPFWEDQGQPSPAVTCSAEVGTLTIGGFGAQRTWAFVVGRDGHLWARSPVPKGGAWVDHGLPSNRQLRATLPPVAAGMAADEPHVPVLADDGQLWLRLAGGPEWRWDNHGAPPGRLIFALVGAIALGPAQDRRLIVAIVADDGHLWLSLSDGGALTWVDLGAPATDKVAGGIGVVTTSGPDGDGMKLFVVGTPSGRVWVRDWAPSGGDTWADIGSPGAMRIHGGVGVISDPRPGTGRMVMVIGGDRQLWAHAGASGQPWERWGLPRDTTALAGGRAVVLEMLAPQPIAMMVGNDRRMWMATPQQAE